MANMAGRAKYNLVWFAALLCTTCATWAVDQSEAWWSLQPLKKTTVPALGGDWIKTPTDAFILATLREKNLRPSPPADKRTLLRRVYFDLIGLPPTPEELDAFLADQHPDAFARVADNLLASPRYGERWARHWLDVVHYAETHGHDQDRPRTNSWPYRDYVIEAFNGDKPYTRFVEEQVAGDVLYPENPKAVVALGFLATGPWDESSLRDIREDTIDRRVARYLDRDDIVMTTMNTFVSTTVQCARCHDHKFDPITQREYYNLQAVFAATDKAERIFDDDPAIYAKRQQLLRKRRAIERRDPDLLASINAEQSRAEIAHWEKELREKIVPWQTLRPESIASSNGSALTLQTDGSVLASGERHEKDTYVLSATEDFSGITAIRLEVLADDSLPKKGPGRQDNGNLHLTNFRVEAIGKDRSTKAVRLTKAAADFNQKDWEIEKAIDADAKTAWGIYPQVGKSHQAVFELEKPVPQHTDRLTFVLEQNHGGGHLIGRPRLSVTASAPPVSISVIPDEIAPILSTSPEERTVEQAADLGLYYSKVKTERELATLPTPRFVYAGASDFASDGSFKPAMTPRAVQVLKRGDINRPGEAASAGALHCVANLSADFALNDPQNEGGRRAALAKWITDPQNTLTWRSIVNRIWHYHFGRGLVSTPNDFGRMGSRPTHPELLDWLAATFLESGGSIKQLHRLILNSAVYQQSSAHDARCAEVDSDNVYLWRMNRIRLDAESMRDAILQITGKIDLTMGGPSVQQFVMSPGIHVTPVVDYTRFDVDSAASSRRSIYRFIFRTLPDPFMDALDCADPSQLTAARNTSVTPLQALAVLNDHFLVRQSEHFASRVGTMNPEVQQQIRAACKLALGRAPDSRELDDYLDYVKKHGLENFCRLLLNSNEFMFVN